MSYGMFQDSSGNTSSKRINGTLTMLTGIALAVANIWLQSEVLVNMLWPLLTTGSALLGASVAERKQ